MTDADQPADDLIAAKSCDGLVSARYDGESVGHEPFVVHDTWTCQVHKSLMAAGGAIADISRMSDFDSHPVSREAIGRRLRLTREALELGQAEFAAKLGMSKTRYENYEAGRNLMKPELILRVITAFPPAKLDFNWLYHGDLNGISHEVAEAIARLAQGRNVA